MLSRPHSLGNKSPEFRPSVLPSELVEGKGLAGPRRSEPWNHHLPSRSTTVYKFRFSRTGRQDHTPRHEPGYSPKSLEGCTRLLPAH